MTEPVQDLGAMLSGLNPAMDAGNYVFVSTADEKSVADALPTALGSFREAEGMTLVLTHADAERLGFDAGPPMRRIVLEVNSALDGVGLTAAIATALATQGVACNVIAAFHHDHVFVPVDAAGQALTILRALQSAASEID